MLIGQAHLLFRQLLVQVTVQGAGKVTMQALITGDKDIGKREARHEATLLEPEYGTERTCIPVIRSACKSSLYSGKHGAELPGGQCAAGPNNTHPIRDNGLRT